MNNKNQAAKFKCRAHQDFRHTYKRMYMMLANEMEWIHFYNTSDNNKRKDIIKVFKRMNAMQRGVKLIYERSQINLNAFPHQEEIYND